MKIWNDLPKICWALAAWGLVGFGCNQVVTVYWSKPGAGNAELQRDKDECQSLQRAVGGNEERIDKCLEAQGWSPIREEIETTTPEVEQSYQNN